MVAAMLDMIMILSINAAVVSETRANTTKTPPAFAVSADGQLSEVRRAVLMTSALATTTAHERKLVENAKPVPGYESLEFDDFGHIGTSPAHSNPEKTDLAGVETRHTSRSSELFSLLQGERSVVGGSFFRIFSVEFMLFSLVILCVLLAALYMPNECVLIP